MSYTTVQLKVTTVGTAGVAVGSVRKGIAPAQLMAVQINYHGSAPGTTDFTLKNVLGGVEKLLCGKDNNNTDIPLVKLVHRPIKDNCGTENTYNDVMVSGELLLEVTGCDALTDAMVVTCILKV